MKILNRITELYKRFVKNTCVVFAMQKTSNSVAVKDVYRADNLYILGEMKAIVREDLKNVFCERFTKGETLYYVSSQGKLIAYGWKKTDVKHFYVYEIGCKIAFNKNITMLYDFWVDEQHRGYGIYKKLLTRIIADSDSKEDLVIFAENDNIPSLKGIRSVGFQHVSDVSFTKRKVVL